MDAEPPHPEMLGLVARIASAHVSNNPMDMEELPKLIRLIYAALSGAGVEGPEASKPKPAVAVNKSIYPGYLVCLEDGKTFKMMKRHLQSEYGMTPDDYRARWSLPADYPMIAPNYAAARSAMAKATGLGRKRPVIGEESLSPPVRRFPEGKRARK